MLSHHWYLLKSSLFDWHTHTHTRINTLLAQFICPTEILRQRDDVPLLNQGWCCVTEMPSVQIYISI